MYVSKQSSTTISIYSLIISLIMITGPDLNSNSPQLIILLDQILNNSKVTTLQAWAQICQAQVQLGQLNQIIQNNNIVNVDCQRARYVHFLLNYYLILKLVPKSG